jgi:hypothetical protein
VRCATAWIIDADAFFDRSHLSSRSVQYLAEQGKADLNVQNKEGRTGMHLAAGQFGGEHQASSKWCSRMQIWLGRFSLRICLCVCCFPERGCLMVVEFLSKVGADTSIADHTGLTVFDVQDKTSGASPAEMRKSVESAVQRGLASAAAAQAEIEAQEQAAREKAEQEAEEGAEKGDEKANELPAADAVPPEDPAEATS